MNQSNRPSTRFHAGDDPLNRIVAFAFQGALVGLLVAILHPFDRSQTPAAIGLLTQLGWVAAQTIGMIVPGLLLGSALIRRFPRLAAAASMCWTASVPMLISLDALSRGWINERFLSSATWRAFGHWESLWSFLDWSNVGSALMAVLMPLVLLGSLYCGGRLLSRFSWVKRLARPSRVLWPIAAALLVALPAIFQWQQTRQWMVDHSARNPICALPIGNPSRGEVRQPALPTLASTTEAVDAAAHRQQQFRWLSLDLDQPPTRTTLPDVVLVIVESMRPELVDPDTMPHLHQLAQNSLWCKRHFSSGNATTHGMFSLLNGLEACWYESPVRFTPLLNRLMRQGGYEIGFFAGDDRWPSFYMDAFIDEKHFDVFQVSAQNGLATDRQATLSAKRFLDQPRDSRGPRLAVLYLYATHAIYHSYAEDQIFVPAADDRLLYPYASSARHDVWNRYRNSAHTVDRFLSSVLRSDRIVIVTGDHGEAFLEDGTIGHGTRISAVQNATAAVIHLPDFAARVIDQPTSHADVLPTMLDALGWTLNRPEALQGLSLLRDHARLASRRFTTRDYLSDTMALIGPWTTRSEQPFAFTFKLPRPGDPIESVVAIDERGDPIPDTAWPPHEPLGWTP